jgi:uncharacterized protein
MAPADALIDTGAILALLDSTDRWHRVRKEAFPPLRIPLLTSEAVLTELFHLFGNSRARMETAWGLLRSGAIVVGAIQDSEMQHVRALMFRFSDRPMDFADATLTFLAERESIDLVLTIDRADFQTYRIAGKRAFRILPVERP